MDEDEVNEGSVGAYDNMERSDIHPGFYSGRTSEEDDEEKSGSSAKDRLRDSERRAAGKVAGKVAKAGLNAVTGGAGGAAIKAGEKAAEAAGKANEATGGALGNAAGGLLKNAKVKFSITKAAPLVLIFGIIILAWAALSFIGQWLFPFGFQARTLEDWNSTETSTAARSDDLMDEVQMTCGEKSDIADVIFDDMGFSDYQIESFKEMGMDYEMLDDCSVAITYTNANGEKDVVVSSEKVAKMRGGEVLADTGEIVVDSGNEKMSDEEARSEILAQLDIAAGSGSVKTFPEAMKDWHFKDKYIRASEYWRGPISGWFNDMTETMVSRLGISRNNYKEWENSSDEVADEQNFMDLAKSKAAASSDGGIGDKSLMERVKDVASHSANENCSVSSAFTDIEGVVTADQTARQVSATSLWLEAIDKTRAGEGDTAPLNAATNMISKADAATTEGMYHLFTGSAIQQSNDMVQTVSAQAHGNNNDILQNANQDGAYRECIYEGNTEEYDGNGGAIARIGSMFRKVTDWIKGLFSNFVDDGMSASSTGPTDLAERSLASTVDAYEQSSKQTYFGGDDTKALGEAMVSGSERIVNEKAKSAGQVTGDNNALIATYRAQQDLIAEKADYDQRNKSPFDITSEHTFLGSIAYSLIPFATSSASTSLTSTISNVGSLLSSSLSNILPTSTAIGEVQVSRGDCVLANNIGSVSNPHCNHYYNSDLSMSGEKPVRIFNEVAKMRYDEAGYVYGSAPDEIITRKIEDNTEASGSGNVKAVVFAFGTNNRGGLHGGGRVVEDQAGFLTDSDIQNLASMLDSGTKVFLVTNYDSVYTPSEGLYDQNNEVLKKAAESRADWEVLDWASIASPSDITANDPEDWNVHPNSAGQTKWVDMIKSAVESTGFSGNEVAIVGDSITEMTTGALQSAVPGACVIGRGGWRWSGGLTMLEECLGGASVSGGTEVAKANVIDDASKGIHRGTREKTDSDYGNSPLNGNENLLPAHWTNKIEALKNTPNVVVINEDKARGCESDWMYTYDSRTNRYIYNLDFPVEWTYSRYTNFEYVGYQSGWHNRTSAGTAGIEHAKNDIDPGSCQIDMKIQADGQPVINKNGALGMFVLASGQRGSDWGTTDEANLQLITKSDFTKGRLHPCFVNSKECDEEPYVSLKWTGTKGDGQATDDFLEKTAKSKFMSRWIGGSAYLYYTGNFESAFADINTGFADDERFKDPTMNNSYFWEENKWYQAYVELLEWMESIGKIDVSASTVAVNDHYKENPLDNSYEGIIARYSGMSKERVIAALDLIEYVAFLDDYDPTNLYPVPAPIEEVLRYDNNEIVATAEKIIQANGVVYDELRNRTVAA